MPAPAVLLRDPRAGDLDGAPASDHALGGSGGQPANECDHVFDREAVSEHERLGRAVVRRGEQFERAPAVGPGAVAQIAKRGERGIGEREHVRVYPNARSGGGGPQSKTNAGVVVVRARSVRRKHGRW